MCKEGQPIFGLDDLRGTVKRALHSDHASTSETTYLLLATVTLNLLSLALPIMTLQVYDRILPHPDSGSTHHWL